MRNPRYILATAEFWLILGCGVAGGSEKSWEQAMAEAERVQQQGKYSQAEMALLGALKDAGKFPPQDPRLAVTLYNLASLYRHVGRTRDAETFFLRSISAWEKCSGVNHPSLVPPLSSLAALYLETGQAAKAERLQRRCMEISGAALKANDPAEAAQLLHNLAALYDRQHRYREAEPLYRQALADLEKARGSKDTEVALVMNNLALLCAKTGRHAEAVSYLERALLIWEPILGPNHPGIAKALANF